jgi:hypothetical protein
MYSVSIEVSHREAKEVSFTIPDFLKEYVKKAWHYDDYIFEYEKHEGFVSTYDTDRAKEYQITPEAYGVYFVYETPEGVKKHYKIDDFEDGDFDYAEDYEEDIRFEEVNPNTLEEEEEELDALKEYMDR